MKVKLQLFKKQILEKFTKRTTEERISFRRITIEENISYENLLKYLLTLIKEKENTLTNDNYALKVQYMDEESDWIDICNENEWEEAKQIYKESLSFNNSPLKLKCVVELDNKKLNPKCDTPCGRIHEKWGNWQKRRRGRRHLHHQPDMSPFGLFSQLFLENDQNKQENKKDESQDAQSKKNKKQHVFSQMINPSKKLWKEKKRESENFFEDIANEIHETCVQNKRPFEKTLCDIFDTVFGEKIFNDKKTKNESLKTTTSNDSTTNLKECETKREHIKDDNKENENKLNQEEQKEEVKEEKVETEDKEADEEDKEIKEEIKEQVDEEIQEEKKIEFKNIHQSSLSSSFVDLEKDVMKIQEDDKFEEENEDEETTVVENTTEINKNQIGNQEESNEKSNEKKDTEIKLTNEEQSFKEEMEALSAMGFSNTKLNMQLLSFYKGDMETVLNTLLKL